MQIRCGPRSETQEREIRTFLNDSYAVPDLALLIRHLELISTKYV